MARTKKVIALLAALVITAGLVAGIAVMSAGYSAPGAGAGLYENGKWVEDPGPAMTVGDNEVSFETYRHFYLSLKDYYSQMYGDENFWNNDPDGAYSSELKRQVETSIRAHYAWLAIAAEHGVTLTDEETAEIQKALDDSREAEGGVEAFLAGQFFTTEETYLAVTAGQVLAQKAQEVLSEELTAEARETYLNDAITAKHILISFDSFQTEEASSAQDSSAVSGSDASAEGAVSAGSDAADDASDSLDAASGSALVPEGEETDAGEAQREALALAMAQDLLAYIRQSGNSEAVFDELMNEYSADTGLATYPDGYTFVEGEMVDEFYEGAKALEVGEISEPIRSTYGYHIILRVPLDETYVEENEASLLQTEVNKRLTELTEEAIAAQPMKAGNYYYNITTATIR